MRISRWSSSEKDRFDGQKAYGFAIWLDMLARLWRHRGSWTATLRYMLLHGSIGALIKFDRMGCENRGNWCIGIAVKIFSMVWLDDANILHCCNVMVTGLNETLREKNSFKPHDCWAERWKIVIYHNPEWSTDTDMIEFCVLVKSNWKVIGEGCWANVFDQVWYT